LPEVDEQCDQHSDGGSVVAQTGWGAF
jgi:hypothetical protein